MRLSGWRATLAFRIQPGDFLEKLATAQHLPLQAAPVMRTVVNSAISGDAGIEACDNDHNCFVTALASCSGPHQQSRDRLMQPILFVKTGAHSKGEMKFLVP
jgi:hypothetical protein